jgi:predicted methyltransferase
MEIDLAEAIVEACGRNGVRAKLQKEYSASWMRGLKTAGVEIVGGDLTKVITAIITNPHIFIEGDLPKFDVKNDLYVSPFRLSLILY